jgi:hypothetical protein
MLELDPSPREHALLSALLWKSLRRASDPFDIPLRIPPNLPEKSFPPCFVDSFRCPRFDPSLHIPLEGVSTTLLLLLKESFRRPFRSSFPQLLVYRYSFCPSFEELFFFLTRVFFLFSFYPPTALSTQPKALLKPFFRRKGPQKGIFILLKKGKSRVSLC